MPAPGRSHATSIPCRQHETAPHHPASFATASGATPRQAPACMTSTTRTETWPLHSLQANPLNPRGELHAAGLEELADSIRAQGVLQPLLITPSGVVVAGHRRMAAARMAGMADVPVVIRELDASEQQEVMLVENLQRQDLSAVELSGIASGTTNSPPLFDERASPVVF